MGQNEDCSPGDSTSGSSENSPGQNTGVGSISLLQGIFPTQGSNPGLPHCRRILYQLSHLGSPYYYSTTTVPILWMRTLRLERLSDEPRSQTREQRGCDLNPRTQARVHSLNTAFRAFSYSLSSLLNKSKTCQEDMLTPFCRRENEFL